MRILGLASDNEKFKLSGTTYEVLEKDNGMWRIEIDGLHYPAEYLNKNTAKKACYDIYYQVILEKEYKEFLRT